MFKRVEKRKRKKEEEEELGLDEDMKDVLGLNNTDSDESDSSTDSGSAGDSDSESEGEKTKKLSILEQLEADEAEEQSEDEDEDEAQPPITTEEALKDPLYVTSIQPDVRGCIVCPGKLLKNLEMVKIHRGANAHVRRFKQFVAAAASVDVKSSAWEVMRLGKVAKEPIKPTKDEVSSKRAEKRKAKLDSVRLKREKHKQKKLKNQMKNRAINKPAAVAEGDTKQPKKKKPKLVGDVENTKMKKKAAKSPRNSPLSKFKPERGSRKSDTKVKPGKRSKPEARGLKIFD